MQVKEFPNDLFLPHVIEACRNGHTATISLKGYSMRPFLEHNRDKAILQCADTYRVGEPVLAHVPFPDGSRRYVLHRIVKISGDNVTLLGDGNLSPEYCKLSDIQARAIAFIRKGRNTPDFITGIKWRLYSAVWMALPVKTVRRVILAIVRRIR